MSRWIGGDGGIAEISAVDQVDGAGLGLTTITVGANFGAEGARRAILVVVCDPGGNDPLTRTIGGATATQITSTLFPNLKLWYALPSGTSGNIVQTYSASQSEGISIMVFRLVRYRSIIPVSDTDIISATGTDNLSGSITIKSKGAALCFNGTATATGRTTTWSAPYASRAKSRALLIATAHLTRKTRSSPQPPWKCLA